jgi:hypothetical protein
MIGRSRPSASSVVSARMLVGVDDAVAHRHRHDLFRECAAALGGDRAFVRTQRQLVLLVARDPVLAAHVLGGLQHAARHGVVDAARVHARAFESILQPDRAALHAPARPRGIELGLAHAVDAARQHELGGPRLYLHAAVQHRLQP